jgi:hypothetical protein
MIEGVIWFYFCLYIYRVLLASKDYSLMTVEKGVNSEAFFTLLFRGRRGLDLLF